MEYLLDRGVRESDVFSTRGDFGKYKTLANQVRLFYNALNSPEIIEKIKDRSYQFLEHGAVSTVRRTAKFIAERNKISRPEKEIGQALGALKVMKEQESSNPFGNYGFSLN